jgi:mRNA-degrading endonuclease toxin of MazEF toxin-antitoxin module
MVVSNVVPEEGDIINFWLNDAQKRKFAINLEPKRFHKHKDTFNGVVTPTQNVDDIYPGDYLLPEGTMREATKVICDQPQVISKKAAASVCGRVSEEDLKEIRKRVASSLGIKYSGMTN